MSVAPTAAPGFWTTVRLLLGVAHKRSLGRRRRQAELFRQRSGKRVVNWGRSAFFFVFLIMAGLNVLAGFVVRGAVTAGERIEVEQRGDLLVDGWFAARAHTAAMNAADSATQRRDADAALLRYYRREAGQLAFRYGGNADVIAKKLRAQVLSRGADSLVGDSVGAPGLKGLPRAGPLAALTGSLALSFWAMMLVFQGEGLELDIQRRRHPMWEWLFSHPVPPGAVFFAEMLAPFAANPIYIGAPLFAGTLYALAYRPAAFVPAALLIGVPISLAAACLGKALETAVMLRLSPRSRGAMIGLMGWLGYVAMMFFFLGLVMVEKAVTAAAGLLAPLAALPAPWLGLFLGVARDGSFSPLRGALFCWAAAGVVIAGSVQFSVWGAQQGLGGPPTRVDRPAPRAGGAPRFGKNALYRKELLWFARDRSALVQAVLVPLTMASVQLFNLRGVLAHASNAWNYLCGTGILFGTYFISVLGPKSLASEGTALWIALTWPQGLESLLKAKAWLWSLISTGVVAVVFCYAAYLFPDSAWKIALVGAGWFLFARSMAEKAVTLATVTSSSGEAGNVPTGRRWAAQLGTFTFAIGVLTQQWNIALMGIFYSVMTAAAMWQNFRARLPYLYDPWSETLPPPPTLMHAMIAISILVDGGAVVSAACMPFVGRGVVAVAYAVIYGGCAAAVSLGVANFLRKRDVGWAKVWLWQPVRPGATGLLLSLLIGVALGLVLGGVGLGYLAILHQFPVTSDMLDHAKAQVAGVPHLRESLFVMAVLIAPVAEEYLFRGLLYRALDREWGGWRAVAGSAIFFALYHPPLSWLPVALLGATNAMLFRTTGRLAPAVVLHMVYNAVVLVAE
jgi:membrane protease YdiL (CAAX protease family)